MSTEIQKDRQVHKHSRSAEIELATALEPSRGMARLDETEISDEALEAVAGGVVANPNPGKPPISED